MLNLLSCPFPALMTPSPDIAFINEEATYCVNSAIIEAVISAIIVPTNHLLVFFISYFTVSVGPSINRPDFSSYPIILIISFVSNLI